MYDDRDNLLGYTEYRYRDGRVVRKNIHGASGVLDRYSTVEYDQKGRRKKETFRRADASVDRQVQFEYFEGKLISEVYYDGGGQPLWQLSYTYGEQEMVSRGTHSGCFVFSLRCATIERSFYSTTSEPSR